MNGSLPLNSFFDRFNLYPRAWSFFVVSVVLLSLHQYMDITVYKFDDSVYWNLAAPSLLFNFPNIMRGYVYPALLMPLHVLSDALGDANKLPFRIGTTVVYAYVLTGPIANFFLRCYGGTLTFGRRTVFAMSSITIFPGLFIFPLSDAPAALLMVTACLLAKRAGARHGWIFLLLAGMCAGAAYNTRTLYLFPVLALVVVCPALYLATAAPLRRMMAPALILAGAFVVAVPQLMINKRVHNVATPMVVAHQEGRSIMPLQLFWGITVQRYETTRRDDEERASRYYVDPAGIALRDTYPNGFGEPSIRAQNPIHFLGTYGRHLVNGVDVKDGLVYMSERPGGRNLSSLICCTLLYMASVVAMARGGFRWRELVELSPLLVAVLAVLPGAIETRFFFPLYLMVLGLVVTQFDGEILRKFLTAHWIAIGVGYAVFSLFFFAISTASMANLRYVLP